MPSASENQHLAAMTEGKGTPLVVKHRPTPNPGPIEVLIEVHSVALNPVDRFQRDFGMPPIGQYPAVLASDVAGVILSVGSNVPSNTPKPGTRVAAYATSFWMKGEPNYGALQTRVIVPSENITEIPDTMSFNEGALLPMAVAVGHTAWFTLGVPRNQTFAREEKEGILIWGGASSMGSMGIQIAKLRGYHVYVTASSKHHTYLKELGADKTFDYHDTDVVDQIIKTAQDEGIRLRTCYDAALTSQLKDCQAVVKAFKGDGIALIAEAKPLPADHERVDGTEARFVLGPQEPEKRQELFRYIFREWLPSKLKSGEIVPSPRIKVIEGGLEKANEALNQFKVGLSGTKMVLVL